MKKVLVVTAQVLGVGYLIFCILFLAAGAIMAIWNGLFLISIPLAALLVIVLAARGRRSPADERSEQTEACQC